MGLPMGPLPADTLAGVITRAIQDNIREKSMRGHTAQDEITTLTDLWGVPNLLLPPPPCTRLVRMNTL
jgi:hypothetical protein